MGLFNNDKQKLDYYKAEVARLERNLKKLSEGDVDFDTNVSEGNQFTSDEKRQFNTINEYLLKIKEPVNFLKDDTEHFLSDIQKGEIYIMDKEKYVGEYSNIASNIYKSFEITIKPIIEVNESLGFIAINDFTKPMENKYLGIFGKIAQEVETLRTKLLYMQCCAIKIANGDTSEIEKLTKIGKRSENDQLAPSFLQMNLTIQELIDETSRLAEEALNGNLDARGDVNKFKGGYINIVNAINGTLDAVVTPMREVTGAMEQISVGNLKVKIDGEFKGEYAKLVDAVNNTVVILNNVVQEIGVNLTKIANADLNIIRIREYKGDFNDISSACNTLIDDLNSIMRDINAAAQQVASGSGQIADTSVMLSQGSEEQASSIEEVTSSITQMAAQVQQNAANATQANSLSITAKENAIKGDEQMEKMIGAMHDINESSSNISKIIKVIDDIAFQTNILALNAAVEAARAGQYGKGFAVVAEEVRNLAQKSASAAQETTTMIENSIDKVKFGTDIANNTEKALKEIVISVTKSSDLVGQIASASNEQASAISQVSQAIEQVSDVVQTNSATAEESASASEELTGQASMLKDMVSKFKLRNERENNNKPIDFVNMSPDLLRAIEEMIEKKNIGPNKKNGPEKKLTKSSSKVDMHDIVLEGEF